MKDILFECDNCGEILAVDATFQGTSLNCVACRKGVLVPTPEIHLVCAQCDNSIGVPAGLAGRECTCPDCEQTLTIPVPAVNRLKLRRATQTDHVSDGSSVAEERHCPACKLPIQANAVICTNCGLDLRTGATFGNRPSKRLFVTKLLAFGIAAGLALIFSGTWLFVHRTNEGKLIKAGREQKTSSILKQDAASLGGNDLTSRQTSNVPVVSNEKALLKEAQPLPKSDAAVSERNGHMEVVEETLVAGCLSRVIKGMIFRTVSGATYEIIDERKNVGSHREDQVAPKVTVLRDKGELKVMFESNDQMLVCRQVLGPKTDKHNKSELEWLEAERGTLLVNGYGESITQGNLIRLTSGGQYEVLQVAGSYSHVSKNDQNLVVVSTNAFLCKLTIGDNIRCLAKHVGSGVTGSGANTVSAAGKPAVRTITATEKCIAVVEAGDLQGTGFIASLGDKKYLITNEHVVRGGSPLRARLLSGMNLTFKGFEVCSDRDVVRMELSDQSLDGLTVSSVAPAVNQPVVTYGNRRGLGVLSQNTGNVCALGPDRLEIDIPLVSGMSGGPIIAEGMVVGISTYSVELIDYKKYISAAGYVSFSVDSLDKKYFGVRIPDATNGVWQPMQWSSYAQSARTVRDIWQCAEHLRDKIFVNVRNKVGRQRIEFGDEDCAKYGELKTLPGQLKLAISTLNGMDADAKSTAPVKKMNPIQLRNTRLEKTAEGSAFHDMQQDRSRIEAVLRAKQAELDTALKGLVRTLESSYARVAWPSSGMKSEAAQARKIVGALVENCPEMVSY